jgi:dihydropyrimidinase/dihydroorotase
MVVVDLGREVEVGPEHLNTRAGWSIMEGHTFTGWPIKTIMRGKVTAEWADDSPGMRPVGEPQGEYLPRKVRVAGPPSQVTSPARLAPTASWLADDFVRPGFSPETTKYTSPLEA